jgi:FAD dependent oxidoreductase TIGR03364
VIVGGGIVGLAHAYLARRRGHTVSVFERHAAATGASIRNFGMIWPIGQPAGAMHQLALRSRELWLEFLRAGGISYRPTGSLHLAYREDEAEVLREFAECAPRQGYDCEWLLAADALERSRAIRGEGLLGALWSATELTVDPRVVLRGLPEYLRSLGVAIQYEDPVHSIELPCIESSRGRQEADVVMVCSGDDFESLYPAILGSSGLMRCKLQMMRTAPQPESWELGPSLAAGLTLRFYKAFQICSSLGKLRERIAREKPEYERYLIHVLVSQTADGAITLGDSHEYGAAVDIFDKPEIDRLILSEARAFLDLPDFEIAQRWHGVYSTHPEKPFFEADAASGVRIVTGLGGSGMTLSFGLAERTLDQLGL